MRAFVLSGGGSHGASQVGALRALLERDIRPDMLVGCSAGALNAAHLARAVTLEQIQRLAEIWRAVSRRDVYPENRLGTVWRFLTGADSLFDNRNFYAFLQQWGTTPATRFGELGAVPFYATATHLATGQLHVFGDNPNDRVLDALMASTALTPMHPPWEVDGERYIDGGTITPLPLRVALERGATEVYALHIVEQKDGSRSKSLARGIVGLLTNSMSTMLRLQAQHDLLLAEIAKRVQLHYICIPIPNAPEGTDFSQADRLMEQGYQAAQAFFGEHKAATRETHPVPSLWTRFAKFHRRGWNLAPHLHAERQNNAG